MDARALVAAADRLRELDSVLANPLDSWMPSMGNLIAAQLHDLPAGTHAFHIHAVGVCQAPFTTAGPHFNPTNRQHGIENPAGMHGGDMPNVSVPESGATQFQLLSTMVSLDDGANGLFDDDGSALVVHATADDYKSDPAGNAGARIACGVVTKG